MSDAKANGGSRSLTARAFNQLKSDILSGTLKPDQRLRLEEIRSLYNIGVTPLREALTRLAANNLVVIEDQRGFRVAAASLEDMSDVAYTRQHIESYLLSESIANGDDAWESEVRASFERLRRASVLSTQGADPQIWEAAHRDFHFSLIARSERPLLQNFHQITWDQASRYRLLGHASEESSRLLDDHEQLMTASLARETELACALLRRHIRVWVDRAIQTSRTRAAAADQAK